MDVFTAEVSILGFLKQNFEEFTEMSQILGLALTRAGKSATKKF